MKSNINEEGRIQGQIKRNKESMKEGKELRMEGHLDEGAPKDALKQECYERKEGNE